MGQGTNRHRQVASSSPRHGARCCCRSQLLPMLVGRQRPRDKTETDRQDADREADILHVCLFACLPACLSAFSRWMPPRTWDAPRPRLVFAHGGGYTEADGQTDERTS